MNRRRWIGSGVAAAAVLFATGLIYESQGDSAPSDPYRFRALDEADRGILAAILPVMLAGSLSPNEDALRSVIEGFDTAVAGLTPSIQGELAQVFTILRVAPLRMIATGIIRPWHLASKDDIARFLNAWRYSNIASLRSAYDALHQTAYCAWYANPQSWPQTGYPGPPKLS
jgi:hypothetical protein